VSPGAETCRHIARILEVLPEYRDQDRRNPESIDEQQKIRLPHVAMSKAERVAMPDPRCYTEQVAPAPGRKAMSSVETAARL